MTSHPSLKEQKEKRRKKMADFSDRLEAARSMADIGDRYFALKNLQRDLNHAAEEFMREERKATSVDSSSGGALIAKVALAFGTMGASVLAEEYLVKPLVYKKRFAKSLPENYFSDLRFMQEYAAIDVQKIEKADLSLLASAHRAEEMFDDSVVLSQRLLEKAAADFAPSKNPYIAACIGDDGQEIFEEGDCLRRKFIAAAVPLVRQSGKTPTASKLRF